MGAQGLARGWRLFRCKAEMCRWARQLGAPIGVRRSNAAGSQAGGARRGAARQGDLRVEDMVHGGGYRAWALGVKYL